MVWEGYGMETGSYREHEYGIIFPKEREPGNPYLWRTEFFGAFPGVDLAMLEKGYAVVYYRISDLYGSETAVALMEAFQRFLQERYGMWPQAILLGFSRGGLYALHYAAGYPERIAALYLDAPVVDIYSWPGGAFSGEGSSGEWEDCRKLWKDVSHEDYLETVDRAVRKLIAWSVPLIIVAGGKDEVVPYEENGLLLQRAYEKSGAAFRLIMKPECGHHPHSLEDPSTIVEFLRKNRSCSTEGNGLRVNDQWIHRYPMTLIIHDMEHLEVVVKAQEAFAGRYPLGYIGTSPWPGSVTNQKTMAYTNATNVSLYDYLRAQMEISRVIYSLWGGREQERRISDMVRDMKEKCPEAGQIWVYRREEGLSDFLKEALKGQDVTLRGYDTAEELDMWLGELMEDIEESPVPAWSDSLEREPAEWTNLSIALPTGPEDKRILLVGDSISVGYGGMVQKLMPGWQIDRLNTSEGIHHPNFLRLLEIALERYPYRLIHLNNGIHLHGQTVEQYGENLQRVLDWIHVISPGTKVVFATTTPLSRSLTEDELEGFDARHFSMGEKEPLAKDIRAGYWVTDEKASEIYGELNEKARQICAEHGIPVNDLYRLCVEENLQKSDGVHFQEEGYRRLAHRVAEALRREL